MRRAIVVLSAVLLAAGIVLGQANIVQIQQARKQLAIAAPEPCWPAYDTDNDDADELAGKYCLDCDNNTTEEEDCSWSWYQKEDGVLSEWLRMESDPFALVVGSTGNGSMTATGTVTITADSAISGSNHTITLQEGAVAMAAFSPVVVTITPPVTLSAVLKLTPVARLAATTCDEAGEAGSMYSSTTGNDLCYCNGSAWQALSGTGANCVAP